MSPREPRSRSHVEWSAKAQATIAEDYQRLHRAATEDPQRAGHGGEATWVAFLGDWLPPTYEVGTRKYVIPEVGDDVFETDIVVFHPSYPTSLREKEEVLSSGVAAAFSVKLTLDAAGVSDACDRAARLERGVIFERKGDRVADYTRPTFPTGLLAHSHCWKAPGSEPLENVGRALRTAQRTVTSTIRELMEFVCVADLACWGPLELAWSDDLLPMLLIGPNDAFLRRHPAEGFPPEYGITASGEDVPDEALEQGMFTSTGHGVHGTTERSNPLAAFISLLYARLAASDPSLQRVADGLKRLRSADASLATNYQWPLDQVLPAPFQRRRKVGRFAPLQAPGDRDRYIALAREQSGRSISTWLAKQQEERGQP